MNRNAMSVIAIACLLAGGLLLAQDEARVERTAVNLSKPGQPAQLQARLIFGSITVRAHAGPEVIVEMKPQSGDHQPGTGAWQKAAQTYAAAEAPKEKHPGMKRIASSGPSLTVEEKDNVVTVEAESWKAAVDLTIAVPARTSLKLESVNGREIRVEGVEGEIEAKNVNGNVVLQRVTGPVVAGTTNGRVECSFARVNPDQPMSFTTFNGDIDVTFPAGIKASVRLKSQNGDVYSDFDVSVTQEDWRGKEDKRDKGGRFRAVISKVVVGTINGGGASMTFDTFNGDILLRKAK